MFLTEIYGKRVIVTGGRDYAREKTIFKILDAAKPSVVIQGGCKTGADRLARKWAWRNQVPTETYDANWRKHGKAAGPIRNEQMAKEANADWVIAFHGGKGTDNMKKMANKYNIKLMVIVEPEDMKPKPSADLLIVYDEMEFNGKS